MSVEAHRRRMAQALMHVTHYLWMADGNADVLRGTCPRFRYWEDELADQKKWLAQNDPEYKEIT